LSEAYGCVRPIFEELVPLEPSHVFDLPLYLLEHEAQLRFEPRPPVVSKVTGEQPRLLEEQAHVLQLREL
jgi:hypothetical protein